MPSPKPSSSRALKRYTDKRDFSVTPEPPPALQAPQASRGPLGFVVQKHWASRLHYDFRLELDGVLVSWALPKGLSVDPAEKRIAVHVEDHPVSYGSFEGTIPKGQYGAGTVIVWDRGQWEPVGDPRQGMAAGKLVFRLHGEKLAGLWELVRIAKPGQRQQAWMLFKKRDAWARPAAEYDVISALPDSVIARPLGPIEMRQPRGSPAAAAGGAASAPAPRRAAELPGAAPAELPAALAPQLASAADAAPLRGEWIHELKFDGYRLLTRVDAAGQATLFTRNGHDWTAKLEPLAAAIQAWSARAGGAGNAGGGPRSSWLDGEIVVLRADGTPDFNALQNAIDSARGEAIRYFLFDLPFHDGHDLRRAPLFARRALLRQLLEAHEAGDDDHDQRLRFSADFAADAASLLESARALGLEGIIAKRADAPYVSARSDSWLKLKIGARQEFVIGGFTERQGAAGEVGSLILGVHEASGALRHAGSVGTGWDAKTAAALRQRLAPLQASASPFAAGSPDPGRWSRRSAGSERWLRPELVAEVRFSGWTPAGHVRHAVFVALRADKPAHEVKREPGTALPPVRAGEGRRGIAVTNPKRVIDPSSGLTKLDLVRYYESVAERLLPHLAGRPVSLVRGPEGIAGELFFQKHDEAKSIPGLRELDAALWPGHAALLEVPTADALLAAAQMNVIEFHAWNSGAKRIDRPDRVVFDLDPGDGVPWERVQEAALLTRTLLDELGLLSWLKTSGGKGLHIVVPIAPRLDVETVKDFAQAAVQHLARTIPSRFVARAGAANRVGKIFVDWLRNAHGATTAAAFSARARPGLGVSMPVAWDELDAIKGGAMWTIATAREHLSFQTSDPWAGFFGTKQTLTRAFKVLGLASPALSR
jgi:bifunctional non-homologous end joining protein LigD